METDKTPAKNDQDGIVADVEPGAGSSSTSPTTEELTPKSQKDEFLIISPTGEEIRTKKELEQYLKSHGGESFITESASHIGECVVKISKDDSCVFCMEELHGALMSFPCSHVFREKCAREWLGDKSHCPLCRFQLTPA